MPERNSAQAGNQKTHILLLDDHPITRSGMRLLLGGEPDLEICGEAGTAREALELIAALHPDLLIADLSLPDADGIELVKDVRRRFPNLRILVFSMLEEAVYAERILHTGARGYVVKGKPTAEILRAIRRVVQGHIHLSDDLADAVLRRAAHAPGATPSSPIEGLTDRELEILILLGQGMGPAAIAEKLFLSPRTVETHRAHLKAKLGVPDAAALRRYAIEWLRTAGPQDKATSGGP
jgi:DNA-binding NarL/FixJ family response regulator